jgi:ankyrin repeat protein
MPLYWAARNGRLDLVTYFIDALNGASTDTDNAGKTLLHAACWSDNMELIRYLVEEKHLNTNAQDNDGLTPLVECIQQGKVETFEYLMKQTTNSVDTKLVDKSGNNVMHYAAGKGSLSVLKELVDKGVNYNLQNHDGQTPMDFASKHGNVEAIKYLIDDLHATYNNNIFNAAEKGYIGLVRYLVEFKGASVSAKDKDDRTPPFYAATGANQKGGHLNVLRYFLDEKKADTRQKDKKGYTLLHAAVRSGPLDVVKYLVEEKRLDVNAKDKSGFTVLFLSLHGHQFDVFKYLLEEKKADFRTPSPWGTCLHEAAVRGFLDFAKALVENGADMNARHDEGRTPVYYAADGKRLGSGGHLDVLRYFVDEKKANVFQKDNRGYTLLHAVSMSGPLEVAQYLVDEKGLDINAKDKEGFTPQFDAVWANKYDIFQFLLDRNANVRIQTLWGTALHEAAAKGYLDFAKALVEKGADLTAKHEGYTPVFYAADGKRQGDGGHLDVLRYFLEEKKADPRQKGDKGATLLLGAVKSGPLDVVKYLV